MISASNGNAFMVRVAMIVALGGFLMGFDSSVISGVVRFIAVEFSLGSFGVGWAVSSLTLAATLAMIVAGPLSDRLGRRPVLKIAAVLYAISALVSAMAPNYTVLVLARMLGGVGVGASLIIAPMYIAEMAPPAVRGRLVSFNQFNIVIGISIAFFSNYLILSVGQSDFYLNTLLRLGEWNWRWMLGIELLPAVIYFVALLRVPESPRWLVMQGREKEALTVLEKSNGLERANQALDIIRRSLEVTPNAEKQSFAALFSPAMRLVLVIGISVGVLQQISGINAVFYYAPMIFEQSGIGTNAAFMQAVLVGIVNIVFTVVAMFLIDRAGRRVLLLFGLSGITLCMLTLAYGFGSATYRLDQQSVIGLPVELDRSQLAEVIGVTYTSDIGFRDGVSAVVGNESFIQFQAQLVGAAIDLQPMLILFAILGFVASFAVSLGPVMWVLFSELFPNRIRGRAISFVGLINSAVAFLVTLFFPWQLSTLGSAATFLTYGLFALAGLLLVAKILPETRGRSLEQIEVELVRA